MWQILRRKTEMPTADRALPGRAAPGFDVSTFVNGNHIQPPFPAGLEARGPARLSRRWESAHRWRRTTRHDRHQNGVDLSGRFFFPERSQTTPGKPLSGTSRSPA